MSIAAPLMPEFSRQIDVRYLEVGPITLSATAEECAALAGRFDLISIGKFEVKITLTHEKPAILAKGMLRAKFVQSCAISSEDLPAKIDEPIDLRFVPAELAKHSSDMHSPDQEIEISADDCDEIPFDGGKFDLGEELAQTFAMLIDPFATGPQAASVRAKGLLISEAASGPFAALMALKKGAL